MREIQFRAWDKKQMFYSDSQEDAQIVGAMLGESCIAKFFERFYGQEIMQYTGLRDKNGEEIYEGDIVKFRWNDEWVSPVYWTDERGWTIHSIKAWEYTLASSGTVEVIGNIYENPELLKETK